MKWLLPKERENDSLRHSTFEFLEKCLPQEFVFEVLRHKSTLIALQTQIDTTIAMRAKANS